MGINGNKKDFSGRVCATNCATKTGCATFFCATKTLSFEFSKRL